MKQLLQQALDALETICDPANGSRPRENPFHAMEALRAYLAAPPAAPDHLRDTTEKVAPDGWVMVPREPTREMVRAIGNVIPQGPYDFAAMAVYRAMIAAAPAQPAEDAAQDRVATLFDAIAHGDAVHRAWLKEAIEAHFSGKPVPS